MKKKTLLLILFIFSFLLFVSSVNAKSVNVYVFHSNTCNHCKAAISYLESIEEKYDLNIYKYEVGEEETRKKMKIVEDYFDVSITSVPVVIINNKHMRGYSEPTTSEMYLYNIKLSQDEDFVDEVGIKLGEVNDKIQKDNGSKVYKISFLNKTITLKNNIFYNSIILGLTKSINPIIVLSSLLLVLLVFSLDKKYKYLILSMIIDLIIYLLFSLGVLSLESSFKLVLASRIVIALLFIILGISNINNDVELYNSNKLDKLKSLFKNKGVTALLLVIIYTAFISVIKVSVIGNIPSILLNAAFGYKLVYSICYIIINVIIILFIIGLIKITKLDKYKYSKLIFGVIMFIIGTLLIIKPTFLGL